MRFEKDSDNRSTRCGASGQSLRSELLSQQDGFAEDSPMITACYEAYLSMEKMLATFAQLRGDDVEDVIGAGRGLPGDMRTQGRRQ